LLIMSPDGALIAASEEHHRGEDKAVAQDPAHLALKRVIERLPGEGMEDNLTIVTPFVMSEHSGTLEIPAQSFTARESQGRRSLFDMGSNGRQLRRSSDPLSIEVLPRPDSFPSSTWLPARSLNVEENWSIPPEQLKAGESATRTIRIRGEGLQGAQLPPILFPASDGLKYYPDQPAITDTEVSSGLLGTRQDSAALVPTRAGTWEIPEIRIPWWDTETGELRYAVVPAREITVAATAPTLSDPVTVPAPSGSPTAIPTQIVGGAGDVLLWQVISGVAGLGWLLTLIWILWSRRQPNTGGDDQETENLSESRAFKQLQAACTSSSPTHARRAVIDWACALLPQRQLVSLEQVAAAFEDESLGIELNTLNAALYGEGKIPWEGSALLERCKTLREQQRERLRAKDEQLSLYPKAA